MVSLYFGLSAHHQESEKNEYKFEKCLQMKIFIDDEPKYIEI